MGIKQIIWGGLFACTLSVAANTFADTVVGSGTAGFQTWAVTNLNENGKPYWDSTSMDGPNKNVGFCLTDAPTAHLTNAPGVLPYWGNAFNSITDTGGVADLNFSLQRNDLTSMAILELEVAGHSNINEFGWYNTNSPSVLNPLFTGPESALFTNNFSPSAEYGFYLKSGADTFFTQSSLNSSGDTAHQHFTVFRELSPTGAPASLWIGVEDMTAASLGNNENGMGDYNDVLIRISAIPEPSTAALVLGNTLLMLLFTGLFGRRR
jgi:hypothetical protein